MTTTTRTSPQTPTHRAEASALALRLAHTENALRSLTSGQVDAIVDPDGKAYLLRPAQEHLRQNERRLQAVIESVADVITVVNRGGVILSQSRAVIRVLGYEPEELVGSSIFERIHDDDLPVVQSAFFNVIEGFNLNATVQFRHRIRDGSWRMIEGTLGKLRDVSPASVVFSLRRITIPPPGRPELDWPDEDREDAIHLSHGRRTPFMAALLGIDALAEELRIDSAKPAIDRISQKHELEVRLRLESIDAHQAARCVLELCHREIAAAQVEVVLSLCAEENTVQADWMRLLQVMCNLVKYVVEFSTPGSTISIASTNDMPGRLTFEVAARGIAIESALWPGVFDSLQAGDLSKEQPHGDLRRDLNIARRLAEAQGGTLTASREEPGKGAAFRLILHTAPPSGEEPAIVPREESAAASPSTHPLYILLVEDPCDAVLIGLLERCGHAVFPAPDMLSGIALAENCRFALILSDITLPDGSGYELMKRLRLTRPSLAGISLSGSGMPSDIDHSREAGFSWHLVQPVTLDSLQCAIQTVAAKRREADHETATAA